MFDTIIKFVIFKLVHKNIQETSNCKCSLDIILVDFYYNCYTGNENRVIRHACMDSQTKKGEKDGPLQPHKKLCWKDQHHIHWCTTLKWINVLQNKVHNSKDSKINYTIPK